MGLIGGNFPVGETFLNPRTQNKLVIGEGVSLGSGFVTDPTLPVILEFPFAGTFFRPERIVITKGRIVAVRDPGPVAPDPDTGYPRTVVTLANGANKPLGIAQTNYFQVVPGRFRGNFPSILRRAHIEIPYIPDVALASEMAWACATRESSADPNLVQGDWVKSDTVGHFVKWVSGVDAIEQRMGQVTGLDTQKPLEGWLQWVMWESVQTINEKNAFDPSNWAYNVYDINQPLPPSPGLTGLQGHTDPSYNTYPLPFPFDPLYGFPEQLRAANGIPGLTDGVMSQKEVYEVDLTTSVGVYPGDGLASADNLYVDGGLGTVKLTHDRLARHLDILNPILKMSEIQVYEDGVQLRENDRYTVQRYKGKILIAGASSIKTYHVKYTSLKQVVAGIPTNIDFKGSIGAIRIIVNAL